MAYASLEDAAVNGWEYERQYLCQVHGDRSPSASLNANGAYICYACGDRGHLDMTNIPVSPKSVIAQLDRIDKQTMSTSSFKTETWLDIFDGDGPGDYWLSRFDEETCKHYRLGHTSERATYPLRNCDGDVLGVVYRDLNPDTVHKYVYPPGVKVSHNLFDIHRLDSVDLILTEGATDAMACWEVGVNSATSSYRNGLSDAQVSIINQYGPRRLWVAYDADVGGDVGYERVKALFDTVEVRRLRWDDHFKDLAGMPRTYRARVLSQVLI